MRNKDKKKAAEAVFVCLRFWLTCVNFSEMREGDFITIRELSDELCVSRIAIFKRIQKGDIEAIRIGKIYIIPKREAGRIIHLRIIRQKRT